MNWTVLVTNRFENWLLSLTEHEQSCVMAMVNVLEIKGPNLTRPYVDTIKGSKLIRNLKELRIQFSGRPYRVFFVFDVNRRAVLLCGARKDGKKGKLFYKNMIALAEKEYIAYLKTNT